jgi:hypothetical protein
MHDLPSWIAVAVVLVVMIGGSLAISVQNRRLRRPGAPDHKVGQALIPLLSEEGRAEVTTLIERDKAILAIKRARQLTGIRLLDARRLVGALRASPQR